MHFSYLCSRKSCYNLHHPLSLKECTSDLNIVNLIIMMQPGAALEVLLSGLTVVADFCSARMEGSSRRVSSDAATQILRRPQIFLRDDQKKLSH